MRRNPLSRKPPKWGQQHRLGSITEREIKDLFRFVDPEVLSPYEGVHVTPHPIVATAYAMNRRRVAYNDYELLDVVNPPVLVGLRLEGAETLDADGYVTAKNILKVTEQFEKDGVDVDEFMDLVEHGELEYFSDYSYEEEPFDPSFGLQYSGGKFGNIPEYRAFVEAVKAQLIYQEDPSNNEYDLLRHALMLAQNIVPQSRILRDIYQDEVVAVLVLAPYQDGEESRDDEMTSPPFESLDAFEGMDQPEDFDSQLLAYATVLYGDPRKANRWHGTSLSIAAEALPEIFSPEKVQEALEAGSAYSKEDLEAYAASATDED